jgi:hypothetical protein
MEPATIGGKMLRGLIGSLVAASLTAGCTVSTSMPAVETAAVAEPATLVPLDAMKHKLLAERNRIWKEPESIRDARIGEPYWCPRGQDPVPTKTCICVEANGKNSYGGFTGVHLTGFAFRNANDFEVIGKMGPYATCGRLTPWPEMNGRAPKA